MRTKHLHCPLCPGDFARESNLLTHVIFRHDRSPSEARAILSNTLSNLEEVNHAVGTEGRERLNRD